MRAKKLPAVTIRKARLVDVPRVVELMLIMGRDETRFDRYFKLGQGAAEKIRRSFIKSVRSINWQLLVAEDRGRIVGYCESHIVIYPGWYRYNRAGYIDEVYIEPRYRGQGIATQFIAIVTPWFKEKRSTCIELGIQTRNTRAFAAWSHLKFRPWIVKMRREF
ncbi:MAG: GNAT family N-acetyltransferase [Patescibacteria group bacterium]